MTEQMEALSWRPRSQRSGIAPTCGRTSCIRFRVTGTLVVPSPCRARLASGEQPLDRACRPVCTMRPSHRASAPPLVFTMMDGAAPQRAAGSAPCSAKLDQTRHRDRKRVHFLRDRPFDAHLKQVPRQLSATIKPKQTLRCCQDAGAADDVHNRCRSFP